MDSLRSNLIRLAHSNPKIRPHLLPILQGRQAGQIWDDADAARVTAALEGAKVELGSFVRVADDDRLLKLVLSLNHILSEFKGWHRARSDQYKSLTREFQQIIDGLSTYGHGKVDTEVRGEKVILIGTYQSDIPRSADPSSTDDDRQLVFEEKKRVKRALGSFISNPLVTSVDVGYSEKSYMWVEIVLEN